MNHTPEFTPPSPSGSDAGKELAAAYARVFLGDDDGKRVLADLRKKFGVHRLVFNVGQGGRFDTIAAALIEGERRVMTEVEASIQIGAPGQALKTQP